MGFFDKFKDGFDQGFDSSKRFFKDAKSTTRGLEEAAILRIDIKRIDGKINSLIRDLGINVYSAFIEEGRQSLSRKSVGIKEVLQELEDLRKLRDEKDEKLSKMSGGRKPEGDV